MRWPWIRRHKRQTIEIPQAAREAEANGDAVTGTAVLTAHIGPDVCLPEPSTATTESAGPAQTATAPTRIRAASVRAFTFPKDPAFPDSNEDAYAVHAAGAAVFDGATESFASRRWARLASRNWASGHPDWLDIARGQYEASQPADLHWAQESARTRGSFTTLAAVTETDKGLEISIVGDSCVFLVQEGRIAKGYPFETAVEFSSAPAALGTATDLQDDLKLLSDGTVTVSDNVDCVVLATDAVAAWLLPPDGAVAQQRLELLLGVTSPADWAALVINERSSKALKVDDSTIVVLEMVALR